MDNMNVGMLWFDNDTKIDLTTKVHRAARYYKDKYGTIPDLCYVHPTMFGISGTQNVENSPIRAGEIEIRTTQTVLPNHIWIGINSIKGNSPS
jgi:hypothetical protein